MESAERKRKTLINIKADQKFIDRLDVFWREAGYSTRTDFILDTLEKRMFAKEIETEIFHNVVTALTSEEMEPFVKKAVLNAMKIHLEGK